MLINKYTFRVDETFFAQHLKLKSLDITHYHEYRISPLASQSYHVTRHAHGQRQRPILTPWHELCYQTN